MPLLVAWMPWPRIAWVHEIDTALVGHEIGPWGQSTIVECNSNHDMCSISWESNDESSLLYFYSRGPTMRSTCDHHATTFSKATTALLLHDCFFLGGQDCRNGSFSNFVMLIIFTVISTQQIHVFGTITLTNGLVAIDNLA